MSKVNGLIIPRSYNDYYSKSDNAAMREVIAQNTDSSLSSVSEMPVQNKVVKSALDAAVPVDSVADGEMKPPTSNAVYDAISAEHEGNAPIMASTTTISGPALATNGSVLIMFTDNIAGSDGTTPLALTYNGTSIPVKAHSGESLVDVTAKEIAASTYRYLDKYTSFQMVFDGTNFVIVGNPVVLSSSNYTIYADGQTSYNAPAILERGVIIPFTLNANTGTVREVTLSRTYKLANNINFQITPVSYTDQNFTIASGHWGARGTSSESLTQTNKLTIGFTNLYPNAAQIVGAYWAIIGTKDNLI